MEARSVWHGERGWRETPVYDGADIRPGHRLRGPALIEERTTTVLVGPGDELWVDDDGNFFIDIDLSATVDIRSRGAGAYRGGPRSRCAGPHAKPSGSNYPAHGLGHDPHGAQHHF